MYIYIYIYICLYVLNLYRQSIANVETVEIDGAGVIHGIFR